MKAKKVYEVLNFERGKDPKAAMGIGVKDRMPELIFQESQDSDYVIHGNDKEKQILYSIHTRYSRIILKFVHAPLKNIWSGRTANKLKVAEELIESAGLDKLFKYFSYSPNSSTDVIFFLKEGEFQEGEYEPSEFDLDDK